MIPANELDFAAPEFHSHVWGQRLTVFRLSDISSTPSLGDGLSILQSAIFSKELKMSIDGNVIAEPSIPFDCQLQSASDLSPFFDNLCRAHSGEAVTLSAHNLQSMSEAVYFKTRRFLRPLISQIGLPSGGVNTFAIAGKYKSTSVGIHCDPCHIFLFPLFGEKRIYGWPTSKFMDQVGDLRAFSADGAVLKGERYEPHMHEATIVRAVPGEVIYIPAQYWHINILETAEPSLAVGCSLFCNKSAGDVILPVLSRLQKKSEHATAFRSYAWPDVAIGSPIDEIEPGHELQRFMSDLRSSVALNAIQRRSAGGFLTGRPMSNTTLESPALRLACDEFPIDLFDCSDDGTVYVCANGRVCKTTSAQAARKMVDRLNSGETVAVGDELDLDCQSDVLELCQFLLSASAVVGAEPGMSSSVC